MLISIEEEEFVKLMDLKTRMDVIVDFLVQEKYIESQKILRIAGTKKASEVLAALEASEYSEKEIRGK